jgi:hypothetical protein
MVCFRYIVVNTLHKHNNKYNNNNNNNNNNNTQSLTFPKSFSLNTLICSIFIKTSYGGASLYILKKEIHWKTRTVMEGSTY